MSAKQRAILVVPMGVGHFGLVWFGFVFATTCIQWYSSSSFGWLQEWVAFFPL
jgi:hypothetical protein